MKRAILDRLLSDKEAKRPVALLTALDDGAQALLETPWGTVPARVEVSDELLPGVITVPHGYGLAHVDESGERVETGPRINRLTSADHCDPLTKTPYHKTVPARLRPL